ncbi:MAG: hypothetical protein ABR595_06410 [Psychroflexus sp.]
MKTLLIFTFLLLLKFSFSVAQNSTIFEKQIKDKQLILLEYEDFNEFENQKGKVVKNFIQQSEKIKKALNAETEKYTIKHNNGVLEVTEICFFDSDGNIVQGFKKGIGFTKRKSDFEELNL